MSDPNCSQTSFDEFSPETVDGTSLKEVAQMLSQLDTASSFVKEGVLAYLKNRSHPAFLMPGWDKPLGPDTPASEYATDTVTEAQG